MPAFGPTEQVLTKDRLRDYQRPNHTVNELFNDGLMKRLVAFLKAQGFRRISPIVERGRSAIVLEANNNQILRVVSDQYENPRSDASYVLQPTKTIDGFEGFRIEVLPKVDSFYEIMKSHKLQAYYGLDKPAHDLEVYARDIIVEAAHHGQLCFEPIKTNLGLIKNKAGKNVPVIMDADAIVDIEHVDEKHLFKLCRSIERNPHLQDLLQMQVCSEHYSNALTQDNFITQMRAWLPSLKNMSHAVYSYKQAQEDNLERLGLTVDKINGVISEADMKMVFKNREHKGSLVEMVEGEGLYRDEVWDIMDKSIKEYMESKEEISPEKFRELIAKHRAQYTTASKS